MKQKVITVNPKKGSDKAPVLWSCGAEIFTALKAAELLEERGINCTVVDARFLKPFDQEKARRFADRKQFTVEDHCISGGLASALREALNGVAHAPITAFGWSDDQIISHGEISILRQNANLTAEQIAEKIADNM